MRFYAPVAFFKSLYLSAMTLIKASSGDTNYLTTITSDSGNVIYADEPVEKGGQNKGFTTSELLASALAACTTITLQMYAANKKMQVEKIEVEVSLIHDEEKNSTFIRKINIEGAVTAEQKKRLHQIAERCPVHRTLSNRIMIETEMI